MENIHKLKTAKTLLEFRKEKSESQKEILPSETIGRNDLKTRSLKVDQENKIVSLSNIQEAKKKALQLKNLLAKKSSTSQTNQLVDTSFCFEKPQSEDDQRRNLIYGNESFKDCGEELNESTVESNNQFFEMVFLNKPKLNQTASTTNSFEKDKSSSKSKGRMSIKDFKLGRKLGEGKFGEVYIARHIDSGFICALKRIDKADIDHKLVIQLIREIKIQSYLNHPNIVKLYTFFCDKRHIYLVMELCFSGQLYGFLKKKRKLNEDLTKVILKDTLKALDYMHERQIIHRDLKPENIIFHNGMIKLCDFGWSISSKTMRETFCGTPLYVSPELLKRKNYNNKIDVWSIGILTYELLFGRVPFDITSERDFIKIVEDEIKFTKATPISNDAKEFIMICLKKDPRDRYTVAELLEHSFITSVEPVKNIEMF